jgi:hypothetical protein
MILGDMLASSPPTYKCSELIMTLMTNKLKFPDGVTITATISPATEEILVPGYRTHSRTSSATTGGFGRRPNAGYKFQFITLAGFHALNWPIFGLFCQSY